MPVQRQLKMLARLHRHRRLQILESRTPELQTPGRWTLGRRTLGRRTLAFQMRGGRTPECRMLGDPTLGRHRPTST
jgi:hypothetical protein